MCVSKLLLILKFLRCRFENCLAKNCEIQLYVSVYDESGSAKCFRDKTVNEKLFISLGSYLLVCLNVVAGKRKQRRSLSFLTTSTLIHSQTSPRESRSITFHLGKHFYTIKEERKFRYRPFVIPNPLKFISCLSAT